MERPRIRKRTSIRSRFLSTVLLTTIFSILAVSIIGAISIRFLRINTRRVLSDQLELNLKNVAQEQVDTIEAKLSHYEKYIEFLVPSFMILHHSILVERIVTSLKSFRNQRVLSLWAEVETTPMPQQRTIQTVSAFGNAIQIPVPEI